MNHIKLNPNMDISLVKYEVNSEQVIQALANNNKSLRDTVILETLDEKEFREKLSGVDFELNVFNSLSCNVNYALNFVDADDREVLSFKYKVSGCSNSTVVDQQNKWELSLDSLEYFRRARKVVVEFTPQDVDTLNGVFFFGSNASLRFDL